MKVVMEKKCNEGFYSISLSGMNPILNLLGLNK